MAVGDVNGDGRQDLATANVGVRTVSVLLGNGAGSTGDGTFTAAASLTTGGPVSVAVGDFNGDGRQDLAATNFNANSVSVFLGNGTGSTGDGTFTATTSPATGTNPQSVVVGDFNGDGRQDLATANINANSVSVLLTGRAASVMGRSRRLRHRRPAAARTRWRWAISTVMAARISRPPTPTWTRCRCCWATGRAVRVTGPFTAAVSPATDSNPRAAAVGDFNGDGRQDLAIASTGADSVSVLLGNGAGSTGDGTFTKAASPATGDGPFSVAVGDFNGDGRQDLATANNSANKVSVLFGNGTGSTGDGTFTAASPATGTNPRSGGAGRRFQR